MKFIGKVLTDVGISKKTNQDSVCLKIANTEHKGQIAMVVMCDGMGGLEKGEVASAEVVRTFSKWFEQELPKRILTYSWQDYSLEWKKLISEENEKILEYGKRMHVNLGTTISAMLIMEGEYMIAHVGDSRIYRIDTSLEQLTEDQTFVAREIKRGLMTIEQAKTDPRRNMLLQCVGASKIVEPDIIFGKIEKETVFVVCSDGFRHMLSEEELYENLKPENLQSLNEMENKGKYLIDLVKNRNEKDNISVALMKSVG